MLKRIKIVTSLLLVLALFGLLQLTSGGLFFNSLKNDKENFTVLQTIRQQQSALNATWVELLQTRNTLNRAGIRWMMDQSNIGSGATVAELMQGATNTLKLTEKNWAQYEALPRDPRQSEAAFLEIKRTYDIYHGALAELIQLLGAGKINEFFDQPTQSYQDAFEKQYMAYMQQNDRLYDIAVEDNNSSYNQAMWVLVSVLIAVLVVIIAVWFGIKLSLIAPMNRLIESIRHIASGDLVKRIDVEGSNEMGQLAENLRHMQSELMRTVGDVRNGANAIYSGASEIAMGNNDLSSRTEQQAAREIKSLIEDSVSRVDVGSTLVESAGETMDEIVNAVTRVTDIMGEIASASDEQSRGIDQVGLAVAEMDRVTQQNASLVEESAAAAAALEEQASRLTQAVAVFRIQQQQQRARDVAAVKTPAAVSSPKAAVADGSDNWETF
ncbi:HAMP domain-containing protein [Salmonella enterica]|nr:HAMP domain-containing protein [Salmonella enterica]EGU3795574.1 HAMP domain-containing protein [Salmonella enterica]EIY7484045.1 Tar ligand binding domain-containing protein [Salmonella enterica]